MLSSKLSSLEVYGIAIRSEIEAARAYEYMATKVEARDVKRKLRFLRDEERKHRAMLEEMYQKDFSDVKLELPDKGLAPKLTGAIQQDSPIQKLFELAMNAEKLSEDFYAQAAAGSESQSGRKLLMYLSGMERGHYFLLKSEFDLMTQFDRYQSYKKFSQEHLGP
jgi:rubrerythrin